MKLRTKRALLAACVLVAVLAAGWAWVRFAPRHVPAGQPPLAWITPSSLSEFRDQFNESSAVPRLVVMLSPT